GVGCGEKGRGKQGIECTGIGPPTVDDGVGHLITINVRIVNVGDLELAAAGWLEGLDDVENRMVVDIKTGDGVFRLWNVGFFFNFQNPITVDDGNPETLRIFDPLQMDLGAMASPDELCS